MFTLIWVEGISFDQYVFLSGLQPARFRPFGHLRRSQGQSRWNADDQASIATKLPPVSFSRGWWHYNLYTFVWKSILFLFDVLKVQIHSSFGFSSAFNLYWGRSIHCLTRGYLWRVMPIAGRLTPQSNSCLAQLLPSNSGRSLCHFPMLAGDSYRIWNDNKTPNSLLTPNS